MKTVLLLMLIIFANICRADKLIPAYIISTIDTGDIRSQSVLTPFFNDNIAASLVIITVDRTNQRQLSLYKMHNNRYPSTPESIYELGDDVIFVDTGLLLNHEVILFFGRNIVWIFDPITGMRTKLLNISSIYNAPIFGSVPTLDFFRDINEDGLDDFIIPNFDGYQVITQTKSGDFNQAQQIVAPPMVDISYNAFPWYQAKKTFIADLNFDQKQDLIYWVNEKFSIYKQLENGQFETSPIRIKPQVDIQFDSAESMGTATQDDDQSKQSSKVLFDIKDFDGDGITDIVTLSIDSRGVFKKTTTYEIFKGFISKDSSNGDIISFPDEPDTRIKSAGIQFNMIKADFNQDNQIDMIVSTVEIGIGKILSALVTGSIKIDLNFYSMVNGKYPNKPVLQKEMTAKFSLSSGEIYFPSVRLGDVNGDKIDDLLIQDGQNKLNLFLGILDKNLFEKKPIEIEVPMPNKPDLVTMVDLNKDGKQDLVMRHQTAGETRKVVVMLSK